MEAATEERANRCFLLDGDAPVPSVSHVAPSLPLGIVIRSGAPSPKPVRFWAYLWAADDEATEDHWHQRVPTERAA